MKDKIVSTYSSGLDTNVAAKWLIDKGYDVAAICLDTSRGKDLNVAYSKTLDVGAVECHIIDATKKFSGDYVSYAIKGNLMYEDSYSLVSTLSRPLTAKRLVEIAEQTKSTGIARGCTGKDDDQVRLKVVIRALNPNLKIFAPVRERGWSREEEIDYATKHGTSVNVNHDLPYSIGQNLWGRANECGILGDPYVAPPKDAYDLTAELEDTPDTPNEVTLSSKNGVPVQLNHKDYDLGQLILVLNDLAGKHGTGHIDHVGSHLVGVKSRGVYEIPDAEAILKAHKSLETSTLTKDVVHFRPVIEKQFAEQTYNGLWLLPLIDDLKQLIDSTQHCVEEDVRVRLLRGSAIVNDGESSYTLYDEGLATYAKEDAFDQPAAVGSINIYGLPTQVDAYLHGGYSNE